MAAASSGTVPTGVPCAWSGDAKPGAGARHYVGQPPANSGSAPTSSCVASLLPAHLPCRLGPSRVAGSVAGTARPPYALGARSPPGDNVWMPEWTCLRCNTTVDGSHHLLQDIPDRPECPAHGPRLLALDLRENSRGWVCARGSPPQILPCMPARILDPQPVDAPPDQASSDRPWYTRGPPSAGSPAHSWIFVPLLHAAVGRLHPQCEQQWASHASLGDIWTRSLQALRLAGPVPPHSLIHALHVLQQLASLQCLCKKPSCSSAWRPPPTLCPLTHSCTCHGHGDSSFCQTGTYRPPPRKHCSTCTSANRRQPTWCSRSQMHRPHPSLPHSTRQTPHSRRILGSESDSTSSSSSRSSSAASSVPEQPSATRTVPDANPLPSESPRPPPSSALDTLQGQRLQAALASLDPFSAEDVLLQPCNVFRSPPAFCKTQLRRAITVALQLIRDASGANPSSQTLASPALARAWKAWLFLPRMLLFRPAQSPRVPKQQLLARFTAFFQGDWGNLLRAALDEAGAVGLHSGSIIDDVARRAERAAHLARLGELSAARQALIAEPLAPPSDSTLRELTDPERRPPHSYRPLPPDLLDFQPDAPVAIDRAALLTNLRRARKGSAPGPSGFTAEMLRLVLDDEEATLAFADAATLLARAQVPTAIAAAIALGRLVALRKPSGGSRGLVVGDLLRRLVARTLAQQFSQQLDAASMHSPRGQERRRSCTPCKPKLKPTLTSRFCPLTFRRLMTLSAGRPCCLHCARCRKPQPCCRSYAFGTPASLSTSGRLDRRHTASLRLRAESKVIRSCRPSSP